MRDFRRDMIELSLKYPFIKKVIISDSAWSDMCASFDIDLKEEIGHTEKHIEEKNGSMRFRTLYVDKE